MNTVDSNVLIAALVVLLLFGAILAWVVVGKRGKSDLRAEAENPLLGKIKLNMKGKGQEPMARQIVQTQEDSAFAEQIASKSVSSEQKQVRSPGASQKTED